MQDDRNRAPDLPDFLQGVGAIQAGHLQIHQHHVGELAVHLFQGFRSAAGRGHVKMVWFQLSANQLEGLRIVIRDQHVLAGRRLTLRDREGEGAALAQLAFHADAAAMQLHQFLGNVQAQAQAPR